MQTQPIEFRPSADEAPKILLPVRASVFADRARRFSALASGHSLGDWLNFLAEISRAQHTALVALPVLPGPDAASLERARAHGMPLLSLDAEARPAAWRDVLLRMMGDLSGTAPETARRTLQGLAGAPDEHLDALADTLLTGDPQPGDIAVLPFIAAALQVVYTALASQLDVAGLQPLPDAHGICPCCGSLPVASIVRISPTVNNLRYLHCSLCNTEWNVTRAHCTSCASDKEVALQQLEGSDGTVRAETCDSCKSYLKIVYQEKNPHADPVADDLATLALDVLVDEAGYSRSGPNLLLIGPAGE